MPIFNRSEMEAMEEEGLSGEPITLTITLMPVDWIGIVGALKTMVDLGSELELPRKVALVQEVHDGLWASQRPRLAAMALAVLNDLRARLEHSRQFN